MKLTSLLGPLLLLIILDKINLLNAQIANGDSSMFIPSPIIKPELIYKPELNIEYQETIDITYIVHFEIDSLGIPFNISIDTTKNKHTYALVIGYVKGLRFKPINNYPESYRDKVARKWTIPIIIKGKKE
jgi:hypothetical protein